MKKRLVTLGIVAILVTVGLSGCNSSTEEVSTPEDKIIGDWILYQENNPEYKKYIFNFYENGSMRWIEYNFDNTEAMAYLYDYSIAGNKLLIGVFTYDFSFSDDNQKLILDGIVYSRQ